MKRKLLFVDDEENILEGLKRLFRPMREEWDMFFAGGGEQALELMEREHIDLIVSDMRMPKMDGMQLLKKVKELHPDTIRFILSGHSEREMLIKSASVAHQYLSKPCEAEELRRTVEHAFNLREVLQNDQLKSVIAQMTKIPTKPDLYRELVEELEKDEPSMQNIAKIIEQDVGMTAKIIQMVNSAYFGLKRKIVVADEAVNFLGLEIIKSLVLTIEVFEQFQNTKCNGFSIDKLFDHSMTTASKARDLAKALKMDRTDINNAFMAGVLHDLGKLLFAANLPSDFEKVFHEMRSKKIPECEAEYRIFKTTHAEVGAYLLGLWGFPDCIVDAVAYHHKPDATSLKQVSALTLVHVMNVLDNESDTIEGYIYQPMNEEYLREVGFSDKIDLARQIMSSGEA